MDVEQRALELLASCLDEWGSPCEAENVREGDDLESYELELRLLSQLLRFGMDTADGHGRTALTPPEGFVLVPVKPTHKMLEAAHAPKGYTMDGYANLHDTSDKYAAMLAARPEVPDGRG